MNDDLLHLAPERVDASFREGFWKWVRLLADGDYEGAVRALRWPDHEPMAPGTLEKRITDFFNDTDHMAPIIPNDRLVALIDGKMEIEWDEEDGWAMALLPVSNEPHRAREDDVSLMGIAVSFFIVAEGDHQVLEFEAFHA